MSRKNAVNVLATAAVAIGSIRGQQHGSLNESYDMIADMWSVYINHSQFKATGVMPNPVIRLTGADALRMMAQMKQARAVWGDPNNADHYVDETGYSALVAAYLGVPVADPHAVPEQGYEENKMYDEPHREAPETDGIAAIIAEHDLHEEDIIQHAEDAALDITANTPMSELETVSQEDLLASIRSINTNRKD